MRTFKSEASGVSGGELLSVLIRPDGSQTKLDNCLAQVVTIRTGGGGEVTALVLAPKKAFQVGLGSVGERMSPTETTTMVEGENYDWFEQWDRMMVWRPKEGPPSDDRAEAALLTALRRQLQRRGPRNKPEAVDALCRDVFGEHLRDLRDLHAILDGNGEMQEEMDDVTVAVARPIDPSEMAELSARVPKDWMPVLERSAGGKTAEWTTAGWTGGGNLEAAQARAERKTKRRWCLAMGAAGVGATVIFLGNLLLRPSKLAQMGATEEHPALPGMPAELRDKRALWTVGNPPPVTICSSGLLLCGDQCGDSPAGILPIAFGEPWPVTFPLAWNVARATGKQCRINCNTDQETETALHTRLISHFPLQTSFNATMSHEQHGVEIFKALSNHRCFGRNMSWQKASNDSADCGVCDVAFATCQVVAKKIQKGHDATLVDFEAPMTRITGAFADYPEDVYEVSHCSYDCWNLSPEARQIAEANKVAAADHQKSLMATTTERTTAHKRSRAPKRKRARARKRTTPASRTKSPEFNHILLGSGRVIF
ncbi:putative transmembrane protein [Gregarina niphandrodes]|uniref:Transmembrane protein n=1 Tax=Gregarina niphandrodes TaxID=110365 RepID=A0A023AZN5_GRENI|nr:putative transmembrane protein [Gregarina niphandrodes]EZG43969.1 putative transmembrane protein [Gregarina niphandrodes]|eukprot:XP_011132871.1 putative transmembrane protein [Gregarina niphandrodes]